MNEFRKKPVVIQAFRLGHDNMPDWFCDARTANKVTTHNIDCRWRGGPDYALIKTLEGEMCAQYGDWIIRGIKGEIYPCKPDIFEATYEVASPAPAEGREPIPMLLFCPECGEQHIDAPEQADADIDVDGSVVSSTGAWDNPPHRSHLCRMCGCIWRPADVPTTGVASIATRGKADTWDGIATAPTMSEATHRLRVTRAEIDLIVSDPMCADHVEISKRALRRWREAIDMAIDRAAAKGESDE